MLESNDQLPVTCPICARVVRKAKKWAPLNRIHTCKSCRDDFATRRQFAYIIDALLRYFVLMAAVFSLEELQLIEVMGVDLRVTARWIAFPMLFTLKDGFNGYSPGKSLMGVQVIDVDTREPIGFAQSIKRNLMLVLPYIGVLGIASTMMNGRRWGDGWANTMVIWKRYEYTTPFDPRGIVCVHCGYDLTGNTAGRCPECGLAIVGTRTGHRS